MYPKIGIIILNWNNWPDTRMCLTMLREISYHQEYLEVVVVDNGSTDDSLGKLRPIEDITLLELDKNIGFAGGNNAGSLNKSPRIISLPIQLGFELAERCSLVLGIAAWRSARCPKRLDLSFISGRATSHIGFAPKLARYSHPTQKA